MKRFKYKNGFILIFVGILAISCANIVPLTGGPQDQTPPVLLSAVPATGTLNFEGKTIQLHFDEYVTLNNIQQELLCSPPFETLPNVKLAGKKVQITFEEELKPDMTYQLYFGNAIADNNERNVFPNFLYVFSTGNYIDTMLVEGYVYNAFTLKPEEGVTVGLYIEKQDSVVAKQKPYYVSRTDKMGYFKLQNLQNNPYKIIALKDLNSNLKYDLATEEVAFIDQEIIPYYVPMDTMQVDSSHVKRTLQKLHLFLPQKEEIQHIVSASFLQGNQVLITSKKPLISPNISTNHSFIKEFSEKGDSIFIWIQDTNSIDTLFVELKDPESNMVDTSVRIVRALSLSQKKELKSMMSANISSKHPFFTPLELTFLNPLKTIDSLESIQLVDGEDTLFVALTAVDEIQRKMQINYNFVAGKTYQITVFGNKFVDIYNRENDTLKIITKITTKEDYGDLAFTLSLNEAKCQYIIQLLDSKENIRQEYIVKETAKLLFENLTPQNYRIKIIEDANNNNVWDSGDYWKHQLPETIKYFPKTLDVRVNWIMEETFDWDNSIN